MLHSENSSVSTRACFPSFMQLKWWPVVPRELHLNFTLYGAALVLAMSPSLGSDCVHMNELRRRCSAVWAISSPEGPASHSWKPWLKQESQDPGVRNLHRGFFWEGSEKQQIFFFCLQVVVRVQRYQELLSNFYFVLWFVWLGSLFHLCEGINFNRYSEY